MSQLRVPRVHIVIPSGHTSRHQFAPRYYLPLFAAEHQASLADPSVPVHEEAHPDGIKDPGFFWAEIDTVEIEYERARLLFPRVFDFIYPTPGTFFAAVEKEMERGIASEESINRALQSPEQMDVEIPEWLVELKVRGLNDDRKRNMVIRGVDSPQAVQVMETMKLAEIVSGPVAKALKAATQASE